MNVYVRTVTAASLAFLAAALWPETPPGDGPSAYRVSSPGNMLREPLALVDLPARSPSVSSRQQLATCQKITFEGLGDLRPLGQVPGAISATFVGPWLSIVDSDVGGTGGFANEPSPSTTAFFNAAGTHPITFSEPVQTVTLSYSANADALPMTLRGWSGPNGTGNPIATRSGSILGDRAGGASCNGDPTGNFCKWSTVTIDAPGNFIQSITLPASAANGAGFDDLEFCTSDASGVCTPDATTLCLNDGRFQVRARWQVRSGDSGQANAIALTPDTGYFWFFDQNNVEAVIKVLDACPINGNFWAFAAGLTDVEVVLTVTDTETGTIKIYDNPLGTPFAPIQDTQAFDTCP